MLGEGEPAEPEPEVMKVDEASRIMAKRLKVEIHQI